MAELPHRRAAPAADASLLLDIEGMSCAACVGAVEAALLAVPGVRSASVNYADHSALVSGDAKPEALTCAVRRAGYGASLEAGQPESLRGQLAGAVLRSALALALGAALMLNMHLPFIPSALPFHAALALAVGAVIWFAGGHFYLRALAAAKRGGMTMDTLIALGTGAAYGYSILALFLPETLPAAARHVYFEAALFIVGFVSLGKALEASVRGRMLQAVRSLLDLAPKTATRVRDGRDETIPLGEAQPGDLLRVRPGEQVPVDGAVVEGATSIDESMMTGEAVPVARGEGDQVIAGTQNQTGALLVRAESVGEATRLAQMARQVRQAQSAKPPIGHLVDKVAAVFVPVVLLIAAASALAWWLFGPEPKVSYMLANAMSVLIIACPCALGLAVPISITLGIGQGSAAGLLINNGEALQAASGLTLMALDKTGTLTEGKPQVAAALPVSGEAPLLETALALEAASEHPLGLAIADYCRAQGAKPAKATRLQATPGGGIKGMIAGKPALAGSPAYLSSQGIPIKEPPSLHNSPLQERRASATTTPPYEGECANASHWRVGGRLWRSHRRQGGVRQSQGDWRWGGNDTAPNQVLDKDPPEGTQGATQVFVARAGKLLGAFALLDQPKPSAPPALAALKKQGIEPVMLTGDNPAAASRLAQALGGLAYQAEATPEAKQAFIQAAQAKGERVGMTGDGINDAPALAAAQVSFAMGKGADIALQTADVVIFNDDLMGIARAIALSRRVMRNIWQNLIGAFGYNALLVPVAAGALYPALGLLISPAYAGLAMAASSLTVVLNASRLKLHLT